ncbi:RagB/SusD family nutrient uptake outer membrane protein [Flammeovirga kamogawensis]|uniref:RagB/SusD family nutrient uptake outer membrane protein n=1 Tax=Flammeovirga kamogawensis TaxID=373891 RepID=A0ABX8H2Q6_9BACT|nr:RagB/SusD family nutrient uptake outer membrane protein [Flammeovirga kamogawensis]MBB6462570.1 hypothetical protein [Flammeovirga kamogawensis]QWG09681.1 RagB/SusD family nutrient uptake outer membrane protein [Flammeovirga kamogawensis]TRX65194.1 RagB/SusD family nutrient uptake outer membrane protein [Flammeovirga kamogawensis]
MKFQNIFLATLIIGLFGTSCSKFLEITPKDSQSEDEFFKTSVEAKQALVGIYEILRNDNFEWQAIPIAMTADILSDDMYTGGANSTDMIDWQNMARFKATAVSNVGAKMWDKNYVGIQRANTLLSSYDQIVFKENEKEDKNNFKGEAMFLRAHYYFELLRYYENVPLILETLTGDTWESVQQSSPDEVYAQVAKDMIEAIDLMAVEIPEQDAGRLNKYAAMSELAKVYMFYTGVYNKSALPIAGGGEFSKSEVITMLEDVIQNSGATLVADYADLFNSKGDFNSEVLFEICFTNTGGYDWSHNKLGNYQCIMAGPRNFGNDLLASGWGFGAPSRELENLYSVNDTRKASTILYAKDLIDNQEEIGNTLELHYNYTGMFGFKYTTHAGRKSSTGSPEVNYNQNYHYIRLADVLLMAAELNLDGGNGKSQQYLDQVRLRAGLQSVPATLDNIYKERRLELAFEGHRYWDLMRRGLDYTAKELNIENYVLTLPTDSDLKYINSKGQNITGDYGTVESYLVNFDKNKRGFLPIPQQELDLNASFKQNVGY